MTVFVLMGVSGAGKSTVGKLVASELGVPFMEGDDFHPPGNIAKMSAGTALTDEDRAPWIDAMIRALRARPQRDIVLACSALSIFVRERLCAGLAEPVRFVLLTADAEVIARRVKQRPGHFMQAGMLASQFAALQIPPDAIVIDVQGSLQASTSEVVRHLRAIWRDQRN